MVGDWFAAAQPRRNFFSRPSDTIADPARVIAGLGTISDLILRGDLEDFWYFDDDGMAWRSGSAAWRKRPLQRADYKEFEVGGGCLNRRLHNPDRAQAFAKNKKGKFFASTQKPRPITSLSVIRWKDFSGLILANLCDENLSGRDPG